MKPITDKQIGLSRQLALYSLYPQNYKCVHKLFKKDFDILVKSAGLMLAVEAVAAQIHLELV